MGKLNLVELEAQARLAGVDGDDIFTPEYAQIFRHAFRVDEGGYLVPIDREKMERELVDLERRGVKGLTPLGVVWAENLLRKIEADERP